MPQEFLLVEKANAPRWHISLRIRFQPQDNEEEFLEETYCKIRLAVVFQFS